MSALVGVTVATQSAASALTFGPDGFMDINGSIRYDGVGTVGWANGPEAAADALPTGTSGADLSTCSSPTGAIHAPGTHGLFDCGSSAAGPTFSNPGNGVFSHAFTSGYSASCGGSYGFTTSAKITDDLTQDQYGLPNGTPKDNIGNTYAVARRGTLGDEVYVGLERENATNGDTHVDFEFLQENVTLSSASPCGKANFTSTGNGTREQGDLMLEMNYLNGGFTPTPTVYVWSCTGTLTPISPATSLPANGTACSFNDTSQGGTGATWVPDPQCGGAITTACYDPTAVAIATDQPGTPGYNATNNTISCGGWVCVPPTGSSSLPEFAFTEGAINLDLLGLGVGCESTMMALTRSSGAGNTSQLKYFSPPTRLDTCTPTTTVTTPTNASGTVGTGASGIPLGGSVHDVAVVSPTGTGLTSTAPTGTVNFFLCGPSPTALTGCSTTDTTRQSIGTANPTAGTANSPVTGETTWSSVNFNPTALSQIGNYCFEGDYVPTGKFEASSDNGTAQASLECFSVFGVPDLVTTKVSSPVSTHSVDPGDSVTYTLTFDNSKGTAAAPVNFTDDLTAVLDDATVTTAPALATGSGLTVGSVTGTTTKTFTITGSVPAKTVDTVTYTVQVNNPDAGDHVLTNYLVPTGTNPPGSCLATNPDCATNPVADISILKQASPASITAAGQTVTYTFTVTNTGATTLTGVVVNDTQDAPAGSLASGPTCVSLTSPSGSCTASSSTTLLAGQSASFTATYTATSADLANGSIDDSATATGTPPNSAAVTSLPSLASVPTADLVTSKVSSPASTHSVDPGDSVTYTLTFDNSKGTAAAPVNFTDNLTAVLDDATVTTAPALATGSGLTVGSVTGTTTKTFTITGSVPAKTVDTVTYTVQVNNPDAGDHVLTNYLVPTGTNPPGSCLATNPDCATNPVADISILKTAATSGGAVTAVGQEVTYTFTVTNTGATTLTGVVVNDTQVAPAGSLASGPTCVSLTSPSGSCTATSSTTLLAGQVATFTATYDATANDLPNGSIDDSATATGTPPNSAAVTSLPSLATVPTADLVTTKVSSPASTTSVDPGDSVTYTLTFDNSKGTAAAPVNFTDDLTAVLDDATVTTAPALATGSGLTVGSVTGTTTKTFTITGSVPAKTVDTVTYTVQVNNPDAGDHVLTNYLVPTGTNPPGSCLATNPDCATNPVADIALVKSANQTAYSAAGQTITYSYKVTNTGQSVLDPVVVTDPMTGLSAISCPQTSLAVGATETCTATYVTTAADLLAGSVNNTGTATGTPPQGSPVVATSSVTVPGSDLIVTKISSPASTTSVDPGDSITYTLTFDNTHGTVATPAFAYTDDLSAVLDDATVTTAPALATGSGLTVGSVSTSGSTSTFSITGSVAAGATATVTYTVQVNKPDSGDHVLTNYLVPTGTNPPGSCLATNPDCATNPVADIGLVKTGSIASFTTAGTQVTYSYKVTNTGQSVLDPVVVTDPMTGLSAISCPQTLLAPGATETCTATYTTTSADLTAGAIRNTGTATGTPPQGAPVVATSSVLIPGIASGQQPQVTTTTVAKKALAFTGMQAKQLLTLAGVLIAWGLVIVGIGYSRRRPAPSGPRRRR